MGFGVALIQKKNADSIVINQVGLKDIILSNINHDYYKIQAIEKEKLYEFFTNEIWVIRNNHLIDKTKNEYFYEKKIYRVH